MDSETISRDPSVPMTESNVPPGSFGSFPVLVEEFLNEQVIVEYREGVPVFMFSVGVPAGQYVAFLDDVLARAEDLKQEGHDGNDG